MIRNRRVSSVMAIVLVLVLMMSSVTFAAPGRAISNTLTATFNVANSQDTAVVKTIILDGEIATQAKAKGSYDDRVISEGSWKAISNQKMELYIDPTIIEGINAFTVKDIDSISYDTKVITGQNKVDFSLEIYTVPFDGGDASWYGRRLNTEPMYANNYNPSIGEWNTWSTDADSNQLTFYDSNRTDANAGFYNGPKLQDIQAGQTDWGQYPTSGTKEVINYANETVGAIKFGTSTGGNWTDFNGYIDNIIITLKNGTTITYDLEPSENQETIAIAAVNAATDVTSVREAFIMYADVLAIEEDIMTKFNDMPIDQGRQQAVASAVKMFQPYSEIGNIKTIFEGTVSKEYDKMMFINAVDGANSVEDMKDALNTRLKTIHTNRQNLIDQLKQMEPKYAEIANVLKATTYTKVLEQVNDMSGTALTSLAEALYDERTAVGGKFFGVENITDAIYSILQANPVVLSWNLADSTINATVGQIENATVTATLSPGVDSVTARLAIEVIKAGIQAGDLQFTSIEDNLGSPGSAEEKATWLNGTVVTENGKLTFFWGPKEGTTIDKQVITNTKFKFNKSGEYNINIYLVE